MRKGFHGKINVSLEKIIRTNPKWVIYLVVMYPKYIITSRDDSQLV